MRYLTPSLTLTTVSPPGSGKTMLAKRIAIILPPQVHSISGLPAFGRGSASIPLNVIVMNATVR